MALCVLFSCGQQTDSITDQDTVAELHVFKERDSLEKSTEKFVEDYITAVNTSDWQTNLIAYLPPDSNPFFEQHTAFRKSFPNYKSAIKHLSVDGNEVIVWLNCTANYESTYIFEDIYINEVIQGIEATGQPLSWDETWYFDVVNGKFGEKWDFLKDNYAILEGLDEDRIALK